MLNLEQLDIQLLNEFQKGLPLTPTPYSDMAERLRVDEDTVIARLKILVSKGMISRIGPVFKVNGVGVSTLAAMSVPEHRLEDVAEFINGYAEVNHNYEREHEFNLWFVVTARNTTELDRIIEAMELHTRLEVMALPMQKDYHIDLGFELQWRP